LTNTIIATKGNTAVYPWRARVGIDIIANLNNNLPIAHLFRFEKSNDSIPPRPP
jgi:hypothetical protein